MPGDRELKLVVGIATIGRKEIVQKTINDLARQSTLPNKIIVCPVSAEEDLGDLAFLRPELAGRCEVVSSPKGLCAQRNAIMRAASDMDIILFLDDDFVLQTDYCKNLIDLHARRPEVGATTGTVIADGVTSQGISFEAALAQVRDYKLDADNADEVAERSTYGCNMSFNLAIIRAMDLWFDETLPLYGWLEDLDFSLRLGRDAPIVKSNQLIGVHMGHKSGRLNGLRLGYSQVANPIYMHKKGSLGGAETFRSVMRRIIANSAKLFFSEPWVDRPGRLRGNVRALRDLMTGKLHPQNILTF